MEIWAADSGFPSAVHTAQLRTVVRTLADAGAACVVVAGPPGSGRSTLLDAAAKALSGRFDVIVVGVPQPRADFKFAIASILGPGPTGQRRATPLTILRGCQEALRLGAQSGPPTLLVVDDADRLDQSSLWVLDQLLSESRVRLLLSQYSDCQLTTDWMSCPSGQHFPPVLLEDLGMEGLQRLLRLPPTTDRPPTLLRDVYARAGGNLLRTRWLIEDAAGSGAIDIGRCLTSEPLPARTAGAQLQDLARTRWAGRTGAERLAVELLAVGEPVALEQLEQLVPPATLAALEREGTIRIHRSPSPYVLLAHASDGMVARERLERTRSLELRGRLLETKRRAPESLWDLMRRVDYTQDAGGTVPDLDLLAVATVSNSLNDSPRAIRTAGAVRAPQLHLPAQTELARALFHAKDYERSTEVLQRLIDSTPTVVSEEFARAVGLLLDVLLQRNAEPEVLRAVLDQARQRLCLAVAGTASGDAAMSYQNAVKDELDVLQLYLESRDGKWPRPEGALYQRLCTDQASHQARSRPRHAVLPQDRGAVPPGGPAGVLLLALVSQGLAKDGNFADARALSLRALRSAAELESCSMDLFSTVLGIHSRNIMLGQGVDEATRHTGGLTGKPYIVRDGQQQASLDPAAFARKIASATLATGGAGPWPGGNQFRSTSFAAANGYRALDLLDLFRPARSAFKDSHGAAGQLPEADWSNAFLSRGPSSVSGPDEAGNRPAGDPASQRSQGPGRLSQREREVAALVVAGLGSAAVAAHLGIAVNTVNAHLQRIYGKLGISRRQDLAELWKGLDPAEPSAGTPARKLPGPTVGQ